MHDLYVAGGMTATLGASTLTTALVLQGGDITPAAPITVAGGIGLATLGGVGASLGLVAQGGASIYYAAHGNWDPLMNVGAHALLGASPANPLAMQVLDTALEREQNIIERGDAHQCAP